MMSSLLGTAMINVVASTWARRVEKDGHGRPVGTPSAAAAAASDAFFPAVAAADYAVTCGTHERPS